METLFFGLFLKKRENGLNRTMQYGNGVRAKFDVNFQYCLNRTMQYGNKYLKSGFGANLGVFKSYYVVWKLTQNENDENDIGRLNRTMQYGNFF